MLFAIEPASFVSPLVIRPEKCAEPLLFIIVIATFISTAVRPSKCAEAVHLVIHPCSFVYSPICPAVLTLSFEVVVHELSIVLTAISPLEKPPSVFLAIFVLSRVLRTISPHLCALALLVVLIKLSLVLAPILVGVDPSPLGLVLEPVPFIYVSVRVNEPALAMRSVSLEPPLVDATVHKALHTETLSHPVVTLGACCRPQRGPLTFIVRAILQHLRVLVDTSSRETVRRNFFHRIGT